VTSIGKYAFGGFSCLTNVTIASSVTDIGTGAFAGCSGLTEVSIPASVTNIGVYAFYGCPGLMSFAVDPDNANYKSDSGLLLWKDGTELVSGVNGEVVIPSGVKRIREHAFDACEGLTSVKIPSSVTDIGDGAFRGCIGMASFEVDAQNACYASANRLLLTKDGTELVSGVIGDVEIPSGVTTVRDNAFCEYGGLRSVTIPSSVTSIGELAFYGCTGLTSVTIPASVANLGDGAFGGCSGMMSFAVDKDNANYKSVDGLLLTKDGTDLIAGVNGEVVIPSGVTSIGSGAFRECRGLTDVTIPETVTSIGESAFSTCVGLTSVTVPAGVTNIGDLAFHACSGLTGVTIPSSVGYWAFDECSGLTSVTILPGVTSIGEDTFVGCGKLATVYVVTGDVSRVKALYGWRPEIAFVEIVPVSTWADLKSNLESGNSVKLVADVAQDSVEKHVALETAGMEVTLDLNGHTVSLQEKSRLVTLGVTTAVW